MSVRVFSIIQGIQRLFANSKANIVHTVIKNTVMPYYAVARGRIAGIYMTWADCEAQVKGFSGARYKKFDSVSHAEEFIKTEGGAGSAPKGKPNSNYKSITSNSTTLKRPFSTSASSSQNIKKTYSRLPKEPSESDDTQSDDSDDLGTIISKQLDDIEKRVKSFDKGLDKIIKRNNKSKSNRQAILIEPPAAKKRRSTSGPVDFEEDIEGYVQVYTDGACSANGRQGAKAGLGVYWGEGHQLNMSEPVSGRATNNCGEIQAATQAIKQALQYGVSKLAINTDSQFLINSVTKWLPGWKRKGWKLQSGEPVKNEKDFKELDNLQNKLQIKWNYVEAHRGIHGNEMADQLAKAGATRYNK